MRYVTSSRGALSIHVPTRHLPAPPRDMVEGAPLLHSAPKRTTVGNYSSKSIFLPAAGFGYDDFLYNPRSDGSYLSSTPSCDYNYYGVYFLYFNSQDFRRNSSGARANGVPVRPVRVSEK